MARRIISTYFFIFCAIAGINNCCTPRQATLAEVEPHIRVDGGWSTWKQWSDCSEECRIQGKAFEGIQTRHRLCNDPVRLGEGKKCTGSSEEERPCEVDLPTCPPPVNGNWSPWGQWLICSKTCSLYGDFGLQFRSRACNNPSTKYGGLECPGKSNEIRECLGLKECDIDGGFSEWIESTPCEPNKKNQPCSEGRKDVKRSCTNPKPSGEGKQCSGRTLKSVNCWYETGCSQEIQKVTDITYFRNKNLVEISWRRTPFGKQPTNYLISYWPFRSEAQKKSFTVNLTEKDPYGESYTATIPEKLVIDETYRITIDSISPEKNATYYFGVPIGPVDGRWSEWGFWSDCSKCERGIKIRERKCNNPPPQDGGNNCSGISKETQECYKIC